MLCREFQQHDAVADVMRFIAALSDLHQRAGRRQQFNAGLLPRQRVQASCSRRRLLTMPSAAPGHHAHSYSKDALRVAVYASCNESIKDMLQRSVESIGCAAADDCRILRFNRLSAPPATALGRPRQVEATRQCRSARIEEAVKE